MAKTEHRDLWWNSQTADLCKVIHLEVGDRFETILGGTLDEIQVAYESWGTLNDEADNAVLVIHPLTTDAHASGEFADQPRGWWEPLIGPGRAIDTDRMFVVCPNLLGSCYGTTGPRFPASDGDPYLSRFPLLTPLDIMRVQKLFLEQLGIARARMVIGPSLGGMIAWEWAIEGGDAVDQVVVVAAPLRTTPYQIGLNWLQRRGVEMDLSGDTLAAKWGHTVARGVGMLSYRAPIGMEEKFGRDWFKKPGTSIKDRGMFNIESWLRHHGKRSVKRFDPYTYILLSRAMDLHDIAENRGSLITALDLVRCKVLVVAISSDQLYTPAEVHLGADILDHLDRHVAYAEIRSPHGHDAFLLESEQMTNILAKAPLRQKKLVPTVTEREIRTVRLGILGAGRVAALFLRLLEQRRQQHMEELGLRFEIAAVAEINPDKKLDPAFDPVTVINDPDKLVNRDDVDVVLDLTRGTGSNLQVEVALRRRRPVATPNKALIHRHGPRLERLALDYGVRLAYHNAIAAGWPLLYSVERPLGRDEVQSIQAVLSSTCNLILERMEKGFSFDSALSEVVKLRITEPDPELDYSGWDTAQKLAILVAKARGVRFGVSQVAVRGLSSLDPVLVREAKNLNMRVKLAGIFLRGKDNPVLGVLPTAVPAEGHLGGVRGDNNVVVIDGGEAGEMAYSAKGSGDLPVSTAVLGDLIGLIHPARSWTGRFPLAGRSPEPPRFSHYLAREKGTTVITDTPGEGSVPVLDSLIHLRNADSL